ncbi:RNA polymerase sigma factor [Flavitalea sp.]|nr:RNA polymerase sigma-70 factor [Flavitalea sp.]
MPLLSSSYQEISDLQLFDLVKQDDVKAFEEIYNRYWPHLIDSAYRRLQSKEKAEDIVQEIFIAIYHKRSTIEITSSLKAYLSQAVKFRILNYFRDETTRTEYLKSHFLDDSNRNSFSPDLESRELSSRIDQILRNLPQKCRQTFLLSRKEERSHKEISKDLNISVSTVEKHIVKALKVFRSDLKDYLHSTELLAEKIPAKL